MPYVQGAFEDIVSAGDDISIYLYNVIMTHLRKLIPIHKIHNQ